VLLSWNPSTSSDVVGYNVYRATSPGKAYAFCSSAISGLNYTDGTAQVGQTYTYVVTAVNSAGEESAYSAPVTAAIP
jgi:fibronectin type 3 domain-containing protein